MLLIHTTKLMNTLLNRTYFICETYCSKSYSFSDKSKVETLVYVTESCREII